MAPPYKRFFDSDDSDESVNDVQKLDSKKYEEYIFYKGVCYVALKLDKEEEQDYFSAEPSTFPVKVNKQPMIPQPQTLTPIHVIKNRQFENDDDLSYDSSNCSLPLGTSLLDESFYDPDCFLLHQCRPTTSAENGLITANRRFVQKPLEKIIYTSMNAFQRINTEKFMKQLDLLQMGEDFRLLQFITGIEIEGNVWHSPNNPEAIFDNDLLNPSRIMKEEEDANNNNAGHGEAAHPHGEPNHNNKKDEENKEISSQDMMLDVLRYLLFIVVVGGIYGLIGYLAFFKNHPDFDDPANHTKHN